MEPGAGIACGISGGCIGGIVGIAGIGPGGICTVSGIPGPGVGDGDGRDVPGTETPPVTVLLAPTTCSPACSFVPPGLKAEMYPEAKSAIRMAAITIMAAASASLTISLTTVIPYEFLYSRQISVIAILKEKRADGIYFK
jgi:hypothetical protein